MGWDVVMLRLDKGSPDGVLDLGTCIDNYESCNVSLYRVMLMILISLGYISVSDLSPIVSSLALQ